jgi:hypothetical protein
VDKIGGALLSKLGDFLTRNSAITAKALPLVHTCHSYNLAGIISDSKIKTHYCDVFHEQLNYFFVGRPAYKKDLSEEAADWELPTVFIFSYNIVDAKRLYPFDTGALNKKMLPSFIQMMNRDSFDVADVPNAPDGLLAHFLATRQTT